VPADWRKLYLFGAENIAKGGGARPFVGIHVETGGVYGLDVERDTSPLFILNSSVARFIETFLLFENVIGRRTAAAFGLTDRVREADPETFSRSEWRHATVVIETLPETN
jgi:hypothetical protein